MGLTKAEIAERTAAAKAEFEARGEEYVEPAKVAKAEKRIGIYPENYATPHEYETAREEARLAEKVIIQLPKDNENYKDDVTVCINGRIWQIQRGVQVSVPRAVADILQQSQNQMLLADSRAASLANVYLGDR